LITTIFHPESGAKYLSYVRKDWKKNK